MTYFIVHLGDFQRNNQIGLRYYVWIFFYVQELECLQDHLDDLVTDCREVVGNLTELESEVRWLLQKEKLHSSVALLP